MLELARRTEAPAPRSNRTRECLTALEQKVLWLACWMIHNANHLRDSRDGLKVGGHQASCASVRRASSSMISGYSWARRASITPARGPSLLANGILL